MTTSCSCFPSMLFRAGVAMGLAEWFNVFCQNLVVVDTSTISSRYRAITRRLNTDFWITESESAHSRYVGSYGRNTAINGFSDLDMVFELPLDLYCRYHAYAGNGQSALLQAVRSSLQKTYPSSRLGADGQVVAIDFADGMSFEIVPVFLNKDGSYTFPDSNSGGKWRTTDPLPEIKAIRDRNLACNLNLVRLCRMMRAWKRKWDVPVSGMLIDTLAYQFIENWPHRDKSYFYYDLLCRDFFAHMAAQDPNQEYWRAPGSAQWVYAPKGQFQYKAKRCYNIACEAIAHEMTTPKQEWSAKQKWRAIFGTQFPD